LVKIIGRLPPAGSRKNMQFFRDGRIIKINIKQPTKKFNKNANSNFLRVYSRLCSRRLLSKFRSIRSHATESIVADPDPHESALIWLSWNRIWIRTDNVTISSTTNNRQVSADMFSEEYK
jgi:hypothetical protein